MTSDRLTRYQRALLLRDNALKAAEALRRDAEDAFRAFEGGTGSVSDAVSLFDDAQAADLEAGEYGKLAELYKEDREHNLEHEP